MSWLKWECCNVDKSRNIVMHGDGCSYGALSVLVIVEVQ